LRFSVLLPTRNGGALLADCIASILEQDFDDFELVVSDNANSDATPDILRRFADTPRLKVIRQSTPVPVADNWTAALRASTGQYVLMMGDDDYLLPHALRMLDEVITRYGEPDCVLYNGFLYVAPGAVSTDPISYWSREHFRYGPDFSGEAVLTGSHRMDIVRDMFRFQQRIPLNMQTTIFSRRAIEKESGSIFEAPYPDHYLLNALLIAADKWVYLPKQLVVVGVSPKSFGHYFYSHQSSAGLEYLGISVDVPRGLPGSALVNGMYRWLTKLKERYPAALNGVEIDRGAYVRRQVYAWLVQRRYGGIGTRELVARFARLSPGDWVHLFGTVFDAESWRRLGRFLRYRRRTQTQAMSHGMMALSGIANIRDFSIWAQRQTLDR
jgi:glycosyltransferase involved in cell wall biosynthesis